MHASLPDSIVPSDDGYVHMTMDALLKAPMQHLVSGLDDEEPAHSADCGRVTDICGYTEWTCETLPFLSVGWDWRIDCSHTAPRWVRVGLPRTNVRVVDARKGALQWQENLQVIAGIVDGLPWQLCAREAVLQQHS